MGTLDRVRELARHGQRLPHGKSRRIFIADALFKARAYLKELRERTARWAGHGGRGIPGLPGHYLGPHDDEIKEAEELIHRLAIVCPAVDTEGFIWRGWTRGGQRVTVRRAGQTVVGRRGRARVEDAYEVRINGTLAYRGLRAHAMKQARWATMVGSDGRLPVLETARGRRRRTLLFLARRKNQPRLGKATGGRRRPRDVATFNMRGPDGPFQVRAPYRLEPPAPPPPLHYIAEDSRTTACGDRENFILSQGDGYTSERGKVTCAGCKRYL